MAKTTATIPQGTRDFESEVVQKRSFIFTTIRRTFELYGYQPLETPAFENLETLMGKYGEEGDKLIFKILNNGLDNPTKEEKTRAAFEKIISGKNSADLTERALRYDLTIPFARYVAMNQGKLSFPYKRYQMQPVWRADRPQKGRYREFYQCDADVVGSQSLWSEVELCHIYATVFKGLNIAVTIKINNRNILAALATICGGHDKLIAITVAIDKLDKIGMEKVKEELAAKELTEAQINNIERYLSIAGSNNEKLQQLNTLFQENETGQKGIAELLFILQKLEGQLSNIEIDTTLARGLNYYTGTIFEVKALAVNIGSIGGGGRYDDLTGLFGVPNIPGVGISFGVDRIYDAMEELQVFPQSLKTTTTVLFFNLGKETEDQAFLLLQQLRNKGISGELYHENSKLDKQFKYAEKKNIGFAVIIGEVELASKTCNIKNLKTGHQQTITQQSLLNDFSFT